MRSCHARLSAVCGLGLVAGLLPVAAAEAANYGAPVLEARTQFSSNFNFLNSGSFSQLEINNANQILVRGSVGRPAPFDQVDIDPVLWYGQVGQGGAVFRDLGDPDTGVGFTTVNLRQDGQVLAYERYFGSGPSAFYSYDPVTESFDLLTSQTGGTTPFNVADARWSDTSGLIGFKRNVGAGSLVVVDPTLDTATTLFDASAQGFTGMSSVRWGDDLSAVTLGFNTTLDYRELMLVDPTGVKTKIVDNSEGSFFAFDRNEAGDVVWLQNLSGVNTLRFWDSQSQSITNLLAAGDTVGDLTITSFADFAPILNDEGLIVFRVGTPTNGAIFLTDTDASSLTRIAGTGDTVLTDVGPAQITSLAFSPTLNNQGVVGFVASMGGLIGSGVFTVSPLEMLLGDFNMDGVVDAQDIDLLFGVLGTSVPPSDAMFDLTGSGEITFADLEELVLNILNTDFGDANLDGVVDDLDLATLQANLGLASAGWADGNFSGDGAVTLFDAYLLFKSYSPSVGATAVIPEPSGLAVLLLGAGAMIRRRSVR